MKEMGPTIKEETNMIIQEFIETEEPTVLTNNNTEP